MSIFQRAQYARTLMLEPKAPSGALMHDASLGGLPEAVCSVLQEDGARSAGRPPHAALRALSPPSEVPSSDVPESLAGLADLVLLPAQEDHGPNSAMAIFKLPDAVRPSIPIKTACGVARETVDDAPLMPPLYGRIHGRLPPPRAAPRWHLLSQPEGPGRYPVGSALRQSRWAMAWRRLLALPPWLSGFTLPCSSHGWSSWAPPSGFNRSPARKDSLQARARGTSITGVPHRAAAAPAAAVAAPKRRGGAPACQPGASIVPDNCTTACNAHQVLSPNESDVMQCSP
ncbi:hypothetical protein B0H17DRAFT_1182061 [Mycena rosella]|uniref:Uncharacterized protein n=1 Tax=Mycena rosella TaxID=1033263 RepID=A0AAD7D9N7_MYCRO|nr:hypothetical protein B0H17DRAFT_1182061 [Mycena rosella]